jgi:hypothetical protein
MKTYKITLMLMLEVDANSSKESEEIAKGVATEFVKQWDDNILFPGDCIKTALHGDPDLS